MSFRAPFRLSRRSILGAGAAVALAGGTGFRARADGVQHSEVSPDEALHRLMDGNARFTANAPCHVGVLARATALAGGQHPFACVLSCADSRVVPEVAFDQLPGDLFVIRGAGNFVDEDGLATLEYGATARPRPG